MGQGSQSAPGGRMNNSSADDKGAPKAAQGTPAQQNRATDSTPSNKAGSTGTQAQKPQSGSNQADSATKPGDRNANDRNTTTDRNASGSAQSGERNAGTASQTNVNVNLNTEQRTRIRQTVIKEGNAPRLTRNEVNFNISVGTVVPRTVRVATLPAAVIEIHPAWRGYSYILVGDEIVILEPGSLRIVAIIPA
jgi:hypothetical protein